MTSHTSNFVLVGSLLGLALAASGQNSCTPFDNYAPQSTTSFGSGGPPWPQTLFKNVFYQIGWPNGNAASTTVYGTGSVISIPIVTDPSR